MAAMPFVVGSLLWRCSTGGALFKIRRCIAVDVSVYVPVWREIGYALTRTVLIKVTEKLVENDSNELGLPKTMS